MKISKKPVFFMLFFTGIILFLVLLMQPLTILHFQEYISVLFPKGLIGIEQRNLLLIIQALMLVIIIPVYVLTFIFSWKYSSENPKGDYDPDLVDNTLAEYIWWGVPLIMTLIVGGITWVKTYELDPYRPIASDKKAMSIQVIALDWKWLFIYPEEKIATVNFIQFPENTPLHFEITADAPMNSFWIPHLGGQIYAMPGMRTELNLIANEKGNFSGSSANLSGEGFAGMRFVAKASSEEEYKEWVATAKKTTRTLNAQEYKKLAAPSKNNPVAIYQLKVNELFDQVIEKFMHPPKDE